MDGVWEREGEEAGVGKSRERSRGEGSSTPLKFMPTDATLVEDSHASNPVVEKQKRDKLCLNSLS